MPRPPILEPLNWPDVFDAGKVWADWLAIAESDDRRQKMADDLASLELPATTAASVSAITRRVNVVAIAEDWCGDVIRHAPVMQKLADASANIGLRYLAREDRPDVFTRFLTNGGEAIPKFIFLSDQWVECGSWGPMPEALKTIIARGKACGDVGTARKIVGARYRADANREEVIGELAALIEIAATTALAPPAP